RQFILILTNLSCNTTDVNRDLHSFPTRRSSDLADLDLAADAAVSAGFGSAGERCMAISVVVAVDPIGDELVSKIVERMEKLRTRSEEHTSELQSRENLVCRLLLEKKN